MDDLLNNLVSSLGKLFAKKVTKAVTNKTKTFTFESLPLTVDDLKALPEAALTDVYATAALSVLALLTVGANGLRSVYGELFSLVGGESVSGYASSAVRIVGVGYLSSATADVCAELGEGGIGRALSACGSVEMLLIALPYFKEVLRMGIDLLGALP